MRVNTVSINTIKINTYGINIVGGGGSVSEPPKYAFLLDKDGNRLLDKNGDYLIVEG